MYFDHSSEHSEVHFTDWDVKKVKLLEAHFTIEEWHITEGPEGLDQTRYWATLRPKPFEEDR